MREWIRESFQDLRQHVEAAAEMNLARRHPVFASHEVKRGIDHGGQAYCERSAGFARDGGLHRAAQESLLDQRHHQSGNESGECEPGQGGSRELNARLQIAQVEQQHRAHQRQHEQDAQHQRDDHFAREQPGGQVKTETAPIGHLEVARHEYEAHQQDQHAHATGDARELRIVEQRGDEQPGRVTEQGDAGKTKRDQPEEDREAAHLQV